MITFSILSKTEKAVWLPRLFDLLYDNMRLVTPGDLPYQQEKEQWIANVSPALDKEPRKMILCFVDNELAGFLQYYTGEKLLMIEEVQLKKEYHRTSVFCCLCRHLLNMLPADIEQIEAYADKRNLYSQRIMHKLGMQAIKPAEDSQFIHLRGTVETARRFFQ